ncbi:hypothetical protein N4T77_05455 [Clostridium sp. CX1]|uniref:Transcriptional regulator n=1 Tax=Clostridium tanneri TaxID=3037988 RepID=A0ABU4JN71_9CLOT|nr:MULTISPECIES: CD1247 N-terminal domain-containing protein [unclassified Clostridium]MCT8976039.1 hypothetical protein [Clostridium sp. CX1]MDW8799591.1 hypothetical protein [Clostridium sp. A1-XYC3]
MNSIISKVSYLSGLVDGLDIDKNTKEGRVLVEIVNVLKDMAEEMSDISEAQIDMEQYIDAIDEDLAELQDGIYDNEYEAYEDEGNNFIQLSCPVCKDDIYVDKELLSQREEITCPNCHNKTPITNCQCQGDK